MKRRLSIAFLVSFLLMIGFSTASILPVVVRPLTNGTIQPLTSFSYQFDFTTDLACSNVILSKNATIVTDSYGIGSTEIDVSDLFVDTLPTYMCEYRDSVLRKVHTIGDMLSKNSMTDTLRADYYCNSTDCFTLTEIMANPTNLSQFFDDIGFLTTETDPIFSAENSSIWNAIYNISNSTTLQNYYNKTESDARYLQNESDPIWSSEKNNYYLKTEVYNKTESDGRYLQSFIETDPLFSAENSSLVHYQDINWIHNNQYFNTSDSIVSTVNQTGYTYSFSILWTNVIGRYLNLSQFINDAGFLSVESDPIWSAQKINYYNKTESDGRYLQSFTETDPIFSANNNSIWSAINNRVQNSTLTNYYTKSDDDIIDSSRGNWTLDKTNYYNKTDSDARYGQLSANNVWSGSDTFNQNITVANTKCLGGASGGYICFNSTHTWIG